ncbi:hypothetical protein L249_7148 [Ophiocordyceps polyrhachis-furcata BCC 54312]|uniref:Zinc finger ZPR1-type domain-containing protein n=1 Tax=Ophiocordyceps polyrhachis-furcata BCC 54312 TaxID=1330021 RepID=A0A367LBH3_9HYPO|nr:hypothetical protein L249_7148 [Ophiocordyceps polyrhachis-furcata BCC 54312]
MFALELKAELAGVTKLRPNDTKENPFWYMFKVQCTSCRETHGNFVGVNRFLTVPLKLARQEANEMSGSRGEANFVWKCKNCKPRRVDCIRRRHQRESSASIKSAPVPYEQAEPPTARRILEFDCRGLEFTEFMSEGEWLAEGIDSGTKFTGIEIVEGEWFDYDEKAGEESLTLSRIQDVVRPTGTLHILRSCELISPQTRYYSAMNSDQLAAKVDYLTDAAHLLRSSAPETSAHLMRYRSDLMSQAGVPQPQLQRQHRRDKGEARDHSSPQKEREAFSSPKAVSNHHLRSLRKAYKNPSRRPGAFDEDCENESQDQDERALRDAQEVGKRQQQAARQGSQGRPAGSALSPAAGRQELTDVDRLYEKIKKKTSFYRATGQCTAPEKKYSTHHLLWCPLNALIDRRCLGPPPTIPAYDIISQNSEAGMASDNQAGDGNRFFEPIGAQVDGLAPTITDDDDKPVEEIESLCMNCGKNGVTKLLLTAIPYFRQVVIMSFSCGHCHAQNNEIQAAGAVQPKGVHYELRLTSVGDLSRQVVKSDTATVKFIELDLEIPAGRGQLTNVEGLLSTAVDDLEMGQEARKEQAPEVHDKIADIVTKARAMLSGDGFPFRLYVDDPAGNSFISPDVKDGAGKWQKREYSRSAEQNASLGLGDGADAATTTTAEGEEEEEEATHPDEVYSFPASCPGCTHPCTTQMKMVDIPHFKQVILMSTACDACGYRSNEVKTGGEIPPQGQRLTLTVRRPTDLARDILKSESCALDCPELNLHVNPGTLGGRFTTVEGLLTQVRADLHGHMLGDDSLSREDKSNWSSFFDRLDDAIAGSSPFTLVLSDPLAASFIQPLADPASEDGLLRRESYHRSAEEDEELGLTDMRTEQGQ